MTFSLSACIPPPLHLACTPLRKALTLHREQKHKSCTVCPRYDLDALP